MLEQAECFFYGLLASESRDLSLSSVSVQLHPVNIAARNQLTGDIGDGSSSLTIRTSNGDITIK